MPFRFQQQQSVRKAIRRLGWERIRKALHCLDEIEDLEAIHRVRKNIKKLRALLRLVKKKVPGREYRRATRALRRAAAPLAGPRDAHVKQQALEKLLDHFGGQVSKSEFRAIGQELEKRWREEMRRFNERPSSETIRAVFVRLSRDMMELPIAGKGWAVIAPGIRTTYRAGRKQYRAVLKESSDDQLHRWRKRVKDLWYQVRLLRPIWPKQVRALSAELKDLGEYLGEVHDLVLLKETVSRRKDDHAKAVEALGALIDRRRTELCLAALDLGSRIYTEKPQAFCRRLAHYWKSWRN
jgi:CHAD domain-containing protein